MTTYTAPGPVTNLTAIWKNFPSGSNLEPGITLSWDAPVLTSGTIGKYYVYILLHNNTTLTVEEVFFTSLKRHAAKDSTSPTGYSIAAPKTTAFFPFNWVEPSNYSFPSSLASGTGAPYGAYSFHVYVSLLEENDLTSVFTGVTIFKPSLYDNKNIVHFNPRFSINSSSNGGVDIFQQDSYEEVASCVEMVLNTPTESRTALPDFGLTDLTFTDVDTNTISATLYRWEPRAKIDISLNMDDSPDSGAGHGATMGNVSIKIIDIEGRTV